MAISAGSALFATVSSGVTFSAAAGFGFSMTLGAFGTKFLVSTAIGAAINALTPKPTTPGAAGYTVTARGSNLDHQIIYGQTRVAGAVIADFLAGEGGKAGTRFLHRVQVTAGHEIESYEEVYVNSYKVTEWKANTAAGGVGAVTGITDLTPWYNDPFAVLVPTKLVEVAPDGTETEVTDVDYSKGNALAIQFWTGADDQIASTRLIFEHPEGKWTSDHRLRGRAYVYVRLGRDAEGDNFPTGVPEITAVIKGRKVYDPREVSHDPDDKSTWAWSDNPALCIRDYLTQDFGLGERSTQVDDDLVEAAANVCDQTADDGSTRYTCNGAFTTGIQPYDLLNSILTSMGGLLWYAQGQWRMKPAYWTAPTESFSEGDFRSSISVSTRHSRKDNFNTVEGTFRGPKSNYALTTFPAVDSTAALAADGGTVSKIDLEMPFTDTPEEARRIARIVLERNRQQLTVRTSFGLKAFRVQVGDIINLSLERFGWVNKTFEVTEWSFGSVDQYDIQIELTLREITESVFDEADDGVTFELDNASVPSPLAGLTVGNLSVITNGFFSTDGTFINNLLVNWDAPVNSNVAEYAVEWRIDSFDYAANGGIVTLGTSPTNREVFVYQAYEDVLFRQPDQDGFDFYVTGGGSTLTEQEIRAQFEASAEGVAARSYVISGAKVNGTANEYNIYPVRDDEIYSVRVRAINDFGAASRWAAATVDASKDVTAPNAPTSLSATGGIQSVSLSWIAPTTNTDGTPLTDFREHIVYGGTSSSPTTEIGRTTGRSFTHGGLLDDTTYYYRIKAVDYSGNDSAYSGQDSAVTNAEIADGVSVLVVYADDAIGTNQSLTAGTRRYVQYVEYTGTAPSLPVSGTFVLFVGEDGADGIDPILIVVESPVVVVNADAAGNDDYANTGTIIRVFEGATELVYDSTPVAGQWEITSTSATGLTLGAITDSGTFGTVADLVDMLTSQDTRTATYTIAGKRLDGTNFTRTAKQTVRRVFDGVNPITVISDKTAYAIPVASDGTVNYAGSGPAVQVFEGDTELDYDSNPFSGEWEFTGSPTVESGSIRAGAYNLLTGAISNHSNMTTDTAVIRYDIVGLRANGSAFSAAFRQTITKVFDGTAGDRGAGRWHIDVDAVNYPTGTDGRLPLSSADAQKAWDDGAGNQPATQVQGDQAWFYKGTEANPTAQSVWIYNGAVWNEQNEVIDGNLLVTDTITTDKLQANAVTADKISIGDSTLTSDGSGSLVVGTLDAGKITAGTFDAARIPTLPQSQITDLTDDLAVGIGRATTFYATTDPTANNIGDVWYDTTNNKVKRWSGSAWVEFTIEAESVAATWVYAGTLTAGQVNAVAIDAGSIDVGDLSADRLTLNGTKLTSVSGVLTIAGSAVTETELGNAAVTTVKVDDDAVSEPMGTHTGGTVNYTSMSGGWAVAAQKAIDVTNVNEVTINWFMEQGYVGGSTGKWKYRIRRATTPIKSREAFMFLALDQAAGSFVDNNPGTGTVTYYLEWGTDDVNDNHTCIGTINIFGRKK